MSRSFAAFLVLMVAVAGGGIAWFFLRPRPSEYDVAARAVPELPPIRLETGDWPWWRGPTRDNRCPDVEAPTEWNESNNLIWKTAVAGRGHSSPIVSGNRLFVTSADEQAQRQFLLCLDRGTGEKIWQKTIHEKNFPATHGDNSHASSTPATDGVRVFVAFDNSAAIYVTALDFAGNILWQKEAGAHKFAGSHGYGSSLALWGPYVYVSNDAPAPGWIAAMNRETGEIGWRMTRRTGMGSYGSPVIAELEGRPMLVLAGNGSVTSYDPKNGQILWEQKGLAEVSANTVTISPKMLFASSGYPRRNMLALKADGAVAWKKESKSEVPYPPSMLWNDGYLYVVSDNGRATCYQADTGDVKWQEERFGGSFYSSPLLIGKFVYACDRQGETTVFAASPDAFTLVARNKLDGAINASPVVAHGRLLIRTDTHLYCIGKK